MNRLELTMTEIPTLPGELLYEYTIHFTEIVEYGASAELVLSGREPAPLEGARFDAHFEGTVTGKLAGTIRGLDCLRVRADGRTDLDIRAEITTADGKKVALAATGVGTPVPGTPLSTLRENVTLHSNHPEYAWVNGLQVWSPGQVDGAEGEARMAAYAV
jgi:hypothetical protein